MTLTRFLVFVLLFFAFCAHSHAQDTYEKVHLHLDKPYYVSGDTIWFKAYLVIGSTNQLSTISGALYVELINGQDSLIKSLKIPVTGGTSMGDFVLDDSVDPGNYRIRAYTQWMRNSDDAYFFDQSFRIAGLTNTEPVVKIKNDSQSKKKGEQRAVSQKDSMLQSDIQFFPEGGNLVNGITSRIGFKVTGINGLGVAVQAEIFNQAGKTINSIQSLHAGIGSFHLRPEIGQSYTAKFSFPDGTKKTVALPPATNSGYALGVYQTNKDSILIRINTNNPGQEILLIARSGSETIFSSLIKLNKTLNSIWLEKNAFPTGIAQFTLLDNNGAPLNERIAFVKSSDRMQLSLTTAKKIYNSREQVTIDLKARDNKGKATAATFSVSVVDESKVPMEESMEHTILSNLLLKSELKGYIEKANYYFRTDTGSVDEALDNLMLTQGYRHFETKDEGNQKPDFEVEGLETRISGMVKTLGNKALPNAAVTLMSLKANILKGTTTDSAGRFRFDGIVLSDSIQITLQAKGPKNSNNVEMLLDTVPEMLIGKNKNQPDLSDSTRFIMRAYIENSKKQDSIYEKTGQLNRTQRLRQVNIKARKSSSEITQQFGLVIPEGHADQTIDMKKEKTYANLGIMLTGLLRNVKFQEYQSSKDRVIAHYPHTREGALQIILDGRKLSPDEAIETLEGYHLEPSDIAKLELVSSNLALNNMLGGPSLFIYTKKEKKSTISPNLININPKGFNRVKTFYNPKYPFDNKANVQDLRSTIYWNPNVKTYANGEANFSFFNADGPGKYKVVIEGISVKGELGRHIYYFQII